MRHPHARLPVGLPLLFVALAGCALSGVTERFEAPVITLSDSKVVDLSTETLEALLGLEVRNPNGYNLPVRQVRYRIRVQGAEVAEGTRRLGVQVAAQDSARLEVPVEISLLEIDAAAPDVILTGEIPYELEAWLSVGALLSGHTVYVIASSALHVDLPLGLASGIAFPCRVWQTYAEDNHRAQQSASVASRLSHR